MSCFDDRWFPFMDAHLDAEYDTFNDMVYVTPANKKRFFEGVDTFPTMTSLETMPYLYIQSQYKKWNAFRGTIERYEEHPIVRRIYVEKIERQILRYRLGEDAYNQDDELFLKHSIELYGDVKNDFINYVTERLRVHIASASPSLQAEATEFFGPFLAAFSGDSSVAHELLVQVKDETPLCTTAEAVKELFEACVKKYELWGWKVVIDTTGNKRVFSVNTTSRKINIPATEYLRHRKKPLTELSVQAVAEHEIGVHARRVDNGARSALRLLALGLPDYLRGEEGVATYAQQCVEGADEYYGFERYLALCLARGVDGIPRDFRGVFEGIVLYYRLLGADQEHAQEVAFTVTQRIFRGTSGRTPGVVYTRDLAYMEGNIGMWDLLTRKPEMSQYMSLGKYDMLNSQHISDLKALGIIKDKHI